MDMPTADSAVRAVSPHLRRVTRPAAQRRGHLPAAHAAHGARAPAHAARARVHHLLQAVLSHRTAPPCLPCPTAPPAAPSAAAGNPQSSPA